MDNEGHGTSVLCLIGIDGCGKTTHSHRVVSDLKKRGKKCRYVWFGTPYFFSYPFMMLCRYLGLTEMHRLSDKVIFSEHRYFENRAVAVIWPWIRFVDLILSLLVVIPFPLKRGFFIVCDRFVYDALVDIMTDIQDVALHKKVIGRIIIGMKPRSASVLLLDIDEELAYGRRQDVPSLEYLAIRRRSYLAVASRAHLSVINAGRPFGEVHGDILAHALNGYEGQ